MQLKLRDIEVANDDFERQARNTTSSLEDLESKYNIGIERGVMLEEEVRIGEQEREALRIETQRLRDELRDLKVEAEIMQNKLRHAGAATERQRVKKPAPLGPGIAQPRSPVSEHSPTSTTSSPTVATPPTKSVSSTVSDTPTPPSPPTSESSLRVASNTPGSSLPKTLYLTADLNITPRPLHHSSRPPRHSCGPSIPISNGSSNPSVARRTTLSRPGHSQQQPDLPSSGSLYQIRGLIGKMQKLEERVHSARSKLPAPTSTPPRASPRSGSSLGESAIPATITMRSQKKRIGGSNANGALASTPGPYDPTSLTMRKPSRLSFGGPPPTPTREIPAIGPSRPSSRASVTSRPSISQLPSSINRPSSRQSQSGARTPVSHYSASTASESRRPRSSIGGSYGATHSHGHSRSVSRLSNYRHEASENLEEEVENSETLTPTPARRITIGKGEVVSGIPAPRGLGKRLSGAGRRISSGPGVKAREDGDMGPPGRRTVKKLSGVGETF